MPSGSFLILGVKNLTIAQPKHITRCIINFEDFPLRREEHDVTWKEAGHQQREDWRRAGIVPSDYPGPAVEDWLDLTEIVRTRVRGTRASHSTAPWWQFERPRVELAHAIRGLPRVMARSLTSKHFAFAFVPSGIVFDQTLVVFVLPLQALCDAIIPNP